MNNIVIILAPPCGGKGTQTKKLEKYNYQPISIGHILRTEYANNQEVQNLINGGNMVSDQIIQEILDNKLIPNNNYIFDGFPRVKQQAELFKKCYQSQWNCSIFVINVDESQLIYRMSNRYNCYQCGKVYQSKKLCCDQYTSKREDDNLNAFKIRLKKYQTNIQEIVSILHTNIIQIDGNQKPDNIFNQIISHLNIPKL